MNVSSDDAWRIHNKNYIEFKEKKIERVKRKINLYVGKCIT